MADYSVHPLYQPTDREHLISAAVLEILRYTDPAILIYQSLLHLSPHAFFLLPTHQLGAQTVHSLPFISHPLTDAIVMR